jgi:diphthine synthase
MTLNINNLYNIFLLLFSGEKEQILYKNNKIIENMTLYLIGIGLSTEKDITVKGLEIVKKCDKVYLESYTSLLQCSVSDLETFYDKEIVIANREITEQGDEKIIAEAQEKDIAFLIIGDVFSATTHVQLFKLAKEKNVSVKVINNASVLTAVGVTGLELYKFGKVTSIPFIEDHPNLETPYNVLKDNGDLHTLFLLDLKPAEDKFMTVNVALEILGKIESKKKEGLINDDLLVVGCARLGCDNFIVKAGKLSEIRAFDFGGPLHCLIIPGKMHFVEEEMMELWSD